jgi:hypothetical protein
MERGKVRGQIDGDDLDQAKRVGEVLEALLAQVAQGLPPEGGLLPLIPARRGEKNLAPVSGRADAGTAMDVEANIVPCFADRLAGVQPHTHLKRCAVRPGMLQKCLLGRHRCRRRVPGPGEYHQERVPLGVDLLPVPF